MPYAATTTVSSSQSRDELEKILSRYGASQFGYVQGEDFASVAFIKDQRTIRFTIPMPNKNSREFTHSPKRGEVRDKSTAEKAYEQAVRQKWRALTLVVKAKLEAVDAGISEFEQEFFQYTVVGGMTVYERMHEQVTEAISTGSPVSLQLQLER